MFKEDGLGDKGRVQNNSMRPTGVAVDGQGRIFVADTFNNRIPESLI